MFLVEAAVVPVLLSPVLLIYLYLMIVLVLIHVVLLDQVGAVVEPSLPIPVVSLVLVHVGLLSPVPWTGRLYFSRPSFIGSPPTSRVI